MEEGAKRIEEKYMERIQCSAKIREKTQKKIENSEKIKELYNEIGEMMLENSMIDMEILNHNSRIGLIEFEIKNIVEEAENETNN